MVDLIPQEELAEGIHLNLNRSDLPENLEIGEEYHFLVADTHIRLPKGKKTMLYWKDEENNREIPTGIVSFTGYEHGYEKKDGVRVRKLTRVGIKLESLVS